MDLLIIIFAVYLLFSAVTAGAYWLDKRAAKRHRRRIPERNLHLLELLGGWPGALLARGRLHHKTRKPRYRLVLNTIIAIHLAAWITAAVLILTRAR